MSSIYAFLLFFFEHIGIQTYAQFSYTFSPFANVLLPFVKQKTASFSRLRMSKRETGRIEISDQIFKNWGNRKLKS
jgi:hypothetical protein